MHKQFTLVSTLHVSHHGYSFRSPVLNQEALWYSQHDPRKLIYWPKFCSVWNLNRWLKFRMPASDFIGNLFLIEDWTALTLRRSVKPAFIWWTKFGFQSSVRLPFYQSFTKDWIAPAKESTRNTLCNTHHTTFLPVFPLMIWGSPVPLHATQHPVHT